MKVLPVFKESLLTPPIIHAFILSTNITTPSRLSGALVDIGDEKVKRMWSFPSKLSTRD